MGDAMADNALTAPAVAPDPMEAIFPLGGPAGRTRDPAGSLERVFTVDGGILDAFGAAATQGVLDSPGTGTVLKELQVPAPDRVLRRDGLGINRLVDGPSAISRQDYEASENYRPDIPWSRGMTMARARALADWSDARAVRQRAMEGHPITAFAGGMVGGFGDFVNYIPVVGPSARAALSARIGLTAGRVASTALDAALNTGIAGAVTAPVRAEFGDDVSLEAQLAAVGMGAIVGGTIGLAGRGLEVWRGRKVAGVVDQMATLDRLNAARETTADALASHALTGELDLTPESIAVINRMRREAADIGRAYDQVLADPNGPALDPVVAITPDDIEGTLLARGGFKAVNELEVSRRGWGLVKIIWRHGEQSADPEHLQATRDDVTALPEVVRNYEPASVSPDGARREWRIERDGQTIVYADSRWPDGGRRVVSIYRQAPDRQGAELPLSPRRAAPGSPSDALNAVRDTAPPPFASSTEGRPPAASRERPETVSLPPEAHNAGVSELPLRNLGAPADLLPGRPAPSAPDRETAAASARVGRPDDTAALADQYGVDPKTGSFREEAELAAVVAEGRVLPAEMAELGAAAATAEDGMDFAAAMQQAARCLI
jgi:hypothetical protein